MTYFLAEPTTQPSGWNDPAFVIGQIVIAIIAILGWWQANRAANRAERADTKAAGAVVEATAANVKSDAVTKAHGETRQDMRSLNEQVTYIAKDQPPTQKP